MRSVHRSHLGQLVISGPTHQNVRGQLFEIVPAKRILEDIGGVWLARSKMCRQREQKSGGRQSRWAAIRKTAQLQRSRGNSEDVGHRAFAEMFWDAKRRGPGHDVRAPSQFVGQVDNFLCS